MRARAPLAVISILTLVASLLLGGAVASPAAAAVQVFSIPTSNAGLGRITTAPDGSMWFVMSEVNKVGRITTAGQVQEFALGELTTADASVVDLDVSPDGSVWVTYDSGWHAAHLGADGALLGTYGLGDYPYGGDVRVTSDGAAWITMKYDESGIVRIVPGQPFSWLPNAPESDDVLGEGSDGAIWCLSDVGLNTLTRVGPDANSGVNYPLPDDATYPQGLAAGPVGSIWFTRNDGGTIFTSRNDGEIGYVDASSYATTVWDTGSRTAPQDLVMGPDRTMWFTNAGAEPALGHISAGGVGQITRVGNFEPTSLTFGPDGAVWFTDSTNNVIVRVTTDELQTTNIDVGDGATMTFGSTGSSVGALPKAKKARTLKGLKVPVRITCPATAAAPCSGTLGLQTAKKVRKPGTSGKRARQAVVRPRSYSLAAGKRATVKVKLTRTGKRLVAPRRTTALRATLTPRGATAPTVVRGMKVRR